MSEDVQTQAPVVAEENPYAPPSADVGGLPVAPRSFGWEVAGKVVMVKQSAQFPMIDPYSGGTAETMMLQKLLVRHRPRWLTWLTVSGAFFGVMFSGGRDFNWELAIPGALGVFFAWLLSRVLGMIYPVCTLRLFFEKRTIRKRRIVSAVEQILFLSVIFGQAVFPPWMDDFPVIALALWVIVMVAGLLLNRRLRCTRRSGGRFEIRGFHPIALERLGEEAAKGKAAETAAPLVG